MARLQKNKSVSKIRQFRYWDILKHCYYRIKSISQRLTSYQMFLFRFLGISGIIPLISKSSQQTLSVDLRTLKKCEFCLQLEYLLRGNYKEWRYTIQYPDFPRPLLIFVRDQVLLLANVLFQNCLSHKSIMQQHF